MRPYHRGGGARIGDSGIAREKSSVRRLIADGWKLTPNRSLSELGTSYPKTGHLSRGFRPLFSLTH